MTIEAPDSVLVLRFSALGDVVLTAPAIEALKTAWPRTRVIFAVKERLAHLIAASPYVDEVFPLKADEGPIAFARRLRALKVSVVLDLHNKLRSKILRALLPLHVRSVVWHKRDFKDTIPVKLALRPYHASMRFADRYHAAVEKLVGRALPRGKLRYFLGPGDIDLAEAALLKAGVDLSKPILGLSPGANWQTKRWPAERFGDLAALALQQGVQVVVQGSEDERDLGRAIVARAPGVIDLCGELNLRALGGFVARCTAFVANDSGPMHIARGLGVPTVAFFGSTDPEMFEFPGHRALFAGVECSPCSFFGRSRCPRGHFRCMLDLDVEAAWNALRPLLTSGRVELVSA